MPSVAMRVEADRPIGPWRPIWNWFGHDEPNYTYLPYGRRLLTELAGLHAGPVYVRTHNLLTSGDGTPALKWGSTDAYCEDASGRPVYSWTILDRIFDTYVETGITPFVQVGFMPEALTAGPPPYRHDFPRTGITTGWAWPPKDHSRWSGLIEAWAAHLADRYGDTRVRDWPWEVWNEPDGHYWCGGLEAFCRLHDVTAAAIRRAIPDARVGGPHTCGPADKRAADYLHGFLDHCAHGRNFETGETGTRLDFVAFHAKGRPTLVDGHVRMGLSRQLACVAAGLDIVSAYPEFADVPVILGESDPEGCAACPTATHPENAYREGPLYGAAVVEAIARTGELAERAGVTIEGAVTWAFEFEGEPFFAGYRELATNGIAKPVLNAIRMLAGLSGQRLTAQSTGALPLATILNEGVTGAPDADIIATRDGDAISILLWNYHDDDLPDDGLVDVVLDVVGGGALPLDCRHWRVDHAHSNAYSAFLAMGSPQPPSPQQYARLTEASRLALIDKPQVLEPSDGCVRLAFPLPRHAVSLVSLTQRQ